MTNDEFNKRVFEIEALARRNPKAYQLRVVLLALLGNAYLGFVLVLMSTLLVALLFSIKLLGVFALKLVMVVGFFLLLSLRAVWVSVPKPSGTEIRPGEAPGLFAMIEELCARLGAPRFHTVLVTDDFNAGVVQAPRLGVFGWHRNYLLIGLPLLKCLTVEQFKAVLAHEFGHLAKGHGRLSNWIYRQRLRWARLLGILEANQSRGRFFFTLFLKWYTPYFNAYSFPLARVNEYEADAASVRLTSARTAAEALTNVDVAGSYLGERYWPQIYQKADDMPQPSFSPYALMGQRFAAELDEETCSAWLGRSMARQTTSEDTHPALSDRLQAIGEGPHLAFPADGEAADGLLGEKLAGLTELFDRRWQENVLPAWEGRHNEVQEGRRKLAALDAQAEAGDELSLGDAFERAKLTAAVGDNEESALEQLRSLLERAPDNPIILYSLGAGLLARDDDSGVALVERAMALDEYAAPSACQALRDYAFRQGQMEKAQAWHERFVETSWIKQEAEAERNHVTLGDKFDRHGLSDETINNLRIQLKAIKELRKAYLVKKRVKHLPHRTCYVLGFKVTRWMQPHNEARVARVLGQIQQTVGFPGETLIINVEGAFYRFKRKFFWVRGSRIV